MNLRPLAWAALLCGIFLGGCRALPPPTPARPPIASPDELLSLLKARQEPLKSFAARARVTLISERSYSGLGLLKARMPATLRADIRDNFLGRSLLNFASDGVEVRVLFPKEAKLFWGPATPANLAPLIPPAVTLPQVLRLLTGALPLSEGPPARWDYDQTQGWYLLEWQRPGGALQERLWVEGKDLNPVKDEGYGDEGRRRFTATLGEYGRLAPGLPGKIILETETPKAELRLTYMEMALNPALTPDDLSLKTPAGVAEVPLKP